MDSMFRTRTSSPVEVTFRNSDLVPDCHPRDVGARLYMREKLWNCSQFKKVPGTNTRRSRPRPESEWTKIPLPELAIVSLELWDVVQSRLQSVRQNGGNRTRCGLLPRGLTSRYLLSNLLKCGKCGSNLNRETCKNNLYIPQHEVESVLLANLKDDLLRPESVAFVVEEFGSQLRASLESLSEDIAQWRSRKEKLAREIKNFTVAIAEGGYSKSMFEAIAVREQEIGQSLTDSWLPAPSPSKGKSRRFEASWDGRFRSFPTCSTLTPRS